VEITFLIYLKFSSNQATQSNNDESGNNLTYSKTVCRCCNFSLLL